MTDSQITKDDITYIRHLACKLELDDLQKILKSIKHSESDCNTHVRQQIFKILTEPRTRLTEELEQKIVQVRLSKQKDLQQPLKRRIVKLQTLLQKYQHNATKSIVETSNQTLGFVHKLPFFRIIHSLSKPIHCTGYTIGTFNLTKLFHEIENIPKYIRKSWDIEQQEYKIQIILRLEQVGGTATVRERLPQDICISVNNINCELPELIIPTPSNVTPWRLNAPINITRQVNFKKYEQNTFKITWSNEPHSYVAGVFLSQKLTSEDLLVELKKRDLRSSDLSKEFIKNNFDTSISLCAITLKDPLTTQKMKLPAKGKECEHLQCFEAIHFLQMNEKKQTWACPICKKQVKFEDLEIDEYFLTILQSSNLSDECENVIIFNDGTWAPQNTKLHGGNLKANRCPSSNIKEITIMDSDETNIGALKPNVSLRGSNLPINPNSSNTNDCKASTSAISKDNTNQEKFKPRPVICVLTLD